MARAPPARWFAQGPPPLARQRRRGWWIDPFGGTPMARLRTPQQPRRPTDRWPRTVLAPSPPPRRTGPACMRPLGMPCRPLGRAPSFIAVGTHEPARAPAYAAACGPALPARAAAPASPRTTPPPARLHMRQAPAPHRPRPPPVAPARAQRPQTDGSAAARLNPPAPRLNAIPTRASHTHARAPPQHGGPRGSREADQYSLAARGRPMHGPLTPTCRGGGCCDAARAETRIGRRRPARLVPARPARARRGGPGARSPRPGDSACAFDPFVVR